MAADSYTATLGALLMGTGNDNNTWGANANTSVFQILEDSIANILSSAVTGGTLDLSGTPPPAGPSGARYWMLKFTGTLVSNQICQVPNLSKGWWVNNQTSGAFTLTFKTPAGSASTAIPQGGWVFVWCDAANAINVSPYASGQMLSPNGTAALPAQSWANATSTGWYRAGAGDFRFSFAGTDQIKITSGVVNIVSGALQVAGVGVISNGSVILAADGTQSAPGLSFNSEAGSGLYRIGAGQIGFSVLNTLLWSATVTAVTFALAITVTGTSTFTGKSTFNSTDSMALPTGTTAQRNGSPLSRDFRYNSTLTTVEYWNGSSWIALSGLPRGYIDGLVLSNDSGSPNTVVDIAAGSCRSDDDTVDLKLAAFTKSLAVNWAAGTGQGGLDTGSSTANSTYAVFVIYNPTTLVTDALLSKSTAGSFASPTMPSGYTKKRYVGSILTNNSGNIVAFSQVGDEFLLSSMLTRTVSLSGTTAQTPTLGDGTTPAVPAGVKVVARLRGTGGSNSEVNYLLTSPDESSQSVTTSNADLQIPQVFVPTASVNIQIPENFNVLVRTNTSQQIRIRSDGGGSVTMSVYGWLDQRGKNA